MKQIIQDARSGTLSTRVVPEPRAKRGHVLVQTTASLISAGTERMVVDFARKSLVAKAKSRPDLVKQVLAKARRDGVLATLEAVRARLDEPLPLGYSAAGTVLEVGTGLEGRFRVGDRVAIAGVGVANHAQRSVVPANLAALIPAEVADEEACFSTLGSIALNSVRLLEPRLGDFVAVIGAGLVGQLAAQLLTLHGCRVICFDYDANRLDLAASLGSERTWNLSEGDPREPVAFWTGGLGCDGILVAAATPSSEPLATAAAIARDRARISLVGIVGTEFPYRDYMKKELSIVVSRSYGPGRYDGDYEKRNVKYPEGWVRWTETENLSECLRLMRPGRALRLNTSALITHRFDFSAAQTAYELITNSRESHLGVVLLYAGLDDTSRPELPHIPATLRTTGGSKCVLGVIGGGVFAKTKLLPALKANPDVVLHTLATERGFSAEHTGRRFGFSNWTTDPASVLEDPMINAVLIATPHSSHAHLTMRALANGKAVFVEKPLALTRDELNAVVQERMHSSGFFQVGFNRRFAPAALLARDYLNRLGGVKNLLMRVNAGQLPPESWQRDPEEGGGRILGELCHFVDLARALVGERITSVHALSGRPTSGLCEDVTATLQFADGSIATILYTALGDKSFSKERIECYASGGTIVLDNFRTLEVMYDGRVRYRKTNFSQDKGHRAELLAFVRSVASDGTPAIPEDELIETSLATIAVLESLRDGAGIKL